MTEYLRYSLEILSVILITDFLSGLIHWLEDSYGQPDWPITGRLVTQPNIVHHYDPRYFTKHTWLKSAEVLLGIGGIILVIAALADAFTWHVALLLLLGINANEFHKWTHQSARERPKIATWLQRVRILQTPAHHAQHHLRGKDTHYCVLTNFVNPVLDKLGFWRTLEASVAIFLGAEKREDTSLLERCPRTAWTN
jgi:ubiquitin-conjugating enzyme E2 variant